MAQRPFITCHVLDTTSGKPAKGVEVRLALLQPAERSDQGAIWTATTNGDGRVLSWTSPSSADFDGFVADAKRRLQDPTDRTMVWRLTFHTESYFGKGKTFWPEVELKFSTQVEEEHYHVPLLLGPWSYTTYRGS